MKKLTWKGVYECQECKTKIVGYTTKCPVCKSVVQKLKDEKIVTMKKGKI